MALYPVVLNGLFLQVKSANSINDEIMTKPIAAYTAYCPIIKCIYS